MSRPLLLGRSVPEPWGEEPEPTVPVRSGQIIGGRYRLLRKAGEGGMAVVFAADHVSLLRTFAVKLPKLECLEHPEMSARFRREAVIGSLLPARHFASVLDYGLDRERPYLVMEYLEGEDLRRVLQKEGQLGMRRALLLARDICRALTAIHELGIVHRDLKPSNVFVCAGDPGNRAMQSCKLLDLGVAKVNSGRVTEVDQGLVPTTASGHVIGTLAYMPPEQLRGESGVDARADLYALGAIIYQTLSGRPPFQAENPALLSYRILHCSPEPLGDLCPFLPSAVVDIVHQAMARDAADRPPSAESVAQALSPFLGSGSRAGKRREVPADDQETSPDQVSPSFLRRSGDHRGALCTPLWPRVVGASLFLVGGTVAGWLGHAASGATESESTVPLVVAASAPPGTTARGTCASPLHSAAKFPVGPVTGSASVRSPATSAPGKITHGELGTGLQGPIPSVPRPRAPSPLEAPSSNLEILRTDPYAFATPTLTPPMGGYHPSASRTVRDPKIRANAPYDEAPRSTADVPWMTPERVQVPAP